MRAFLRLPKGIVTIHFEMQQPWHAMYLNAVEASVAHEAFPLSLCTFSCLQHEIPGIRKLKSVDIQLSQFQVASFRDLRYYNIEQEIKPEQLKNESLGLSLCGSLECHCHAHGPVYTELVYLARV